MRFEDLPTFQNAMFLQHCFKFPYHIPGLQICSFTFRKIYKFFSNFFVTISKTSIITHSLNTHTSSPRILFKDQFVVNFRISRSLLHSHEAQTISTQNSCSFLSSSHSLWQNMINILFHILWDLNDSICGCKNDSVRNMSLDATSYKFYNISTFYQRVLRRI